MATHSCILAWRIPCTEETGGLQSMGLQSWTQLSMHTRTQEKKSHFPLNCLKDADGGLYQAESSFQTGLFCLGQLRAWQEDLGLPSVSSSHLPVNCLPSSAAQAPSPSFLQDAASASTV